MTKTKKFFFIGILIVMVPFTGLPVFWKEVSVVILGLIVIALASGDYINFLVNIGRRNKDEEENEEYKKLEVEHHE